MQTVQLGRTDVRSSRLIYGCMRMLGDGSADDIARGKAAVLAAIDAGYTHFDHADIYADGECEREFGKLIREQPGLRERIGITTKCGIRFADAADAPKRYDLSRQHILASVDASLERLGIEQIDVLLLHRPDSLMDPHDVAEAFANLRANGKVANFGVSNFRPATLSMLQSVVDVELVVNQIEVNLHRTDLLGDGTLDYCMSHEIGIQGWSPLAGIAIPAGDNTFTPAQERRIHEEAARQAGRYGVDVALIALAWV
ncbi:MAG: aldo/keto reductase, partial [Pseudomonadota bacterium]